MDILAPGQSIPVLLPKSNYVQIAAGTSESAAIVTATAALLVSCNPYITSQKIRHAILGHSDHYSILSEKVTNGTVLNIKKIIYNSCMPSIEEDVHEKELKQQDTFKDEL